MAENIPNLPPGAVPPSPDQSKVQPKKETVRIQLPPKPTAAPTIKLPTLPQGGAAQTATPTPTVPPPKPSVPTPAQSSAQQAVSAPAAQKPPGTVPPPPSAGTGGARLASTPGPKGAQQTPTETHKEPAKPAPKTSVAAGGVATVSVLDKALAIAAMVTSLAAVLTVVYLLTLLQDALKGGGQ